ncbi:MAG: protein kinase [Gaiellaceae bacterium]
MAAGSDPLIGAQLAGYRIETLVGRGGMGAVYRAEDPRLDRKVAIKVLAENHADPSYRERFLRESKLAASIEHPNILPVHEAGEEDGTLFIVMRYVEGVDLRRVLKDGRLDVERSLRILTSVAAALDAAHACGLVHRDVKPANILLAQNVNASGEEHAYLCDFGVSKKTSRRDLTETGQLVGTVDYVAPEQITGKAVGRASDVYALGAVFFESLTGEPPFRRENEAAVLWGHLQGEIPSVCQRRPDLPPELDAVISRALAKNASDRFPSTGELAVAAHDALRPRRARKGKARTDEPPLSEHVEAVVDALVDGKLVAVLGPNVNFCGRPNQPGSPEDNQAVLPAGNELAGYLAEHFAYPPGDHRALTRVAQYVVTMQGPGPLYDALHGIFDSDFEPTAIHRFLAETPPLLRAHGAPFPLIVTTNYDEALELAFLEAGEEFDVVSYIALGDDRGKFLHRSPDGAAAVVDRPNEYVEQLSLARRPVILKVHGQVDRLPDRSWESFVVTEDDHLDYLLRGDVATQIPVALSAKLRRSHFLFLGCALRDWDFRVVLHRIWGDRKVAYRSWAVGGDASPGEQEFWRERSIDFFSLPLESYMDQLRRRIRDRAADGVSG